MDIFLIFYNSREAVSEFLTVFENNFKPNADLRKSRFKCSFTIVSWQPAPRDAFAEITDTRIWRTNAYDDVYFNDFIKSDLTNDILKWVIVNIMPGRRCRYKRFDRIGITVTSNDSRIIGKWEYFDIMKFIGKYARVEGSDDEMEDDAGGAEVNDSD